MSSKGKEVFQLLKQQLGNIPLSLKYTIFASLSTSTLIPTGMNMQIQRKDRQKGYTVKIE